MIALVLAAGGWVTAQEKPVQKPVQQQQEDLPPEENDAAKPKVYSFNPLQSQKDVKVGDFYLKTKRDARAAANRYREATHWNEGNAEAWLKLGDMDARSDVGNRAEAKQAYQKYLELAPDAKNAAEVKKKLEKL